MRTRICQVSTPLLTIVATIAALTWASPLAGQSKDKQPESVPNAKSPSVGAESISGLVMVQVATLKGSMNRNARDMWMPVDFISPDGRYLYVQTQGEEKAELRSVPDLKVLAVISGPGFNVPTMVRVDQLGIAYNPQAGMFATTSMAQEAAGGNTGEGTKLWSLPGMKLQTVLYAGRDRVFSPDGRFLAATETSNLGGVGIWNVRDGSFKRLSAEKYSVLGFCPTDSFLLTQGVMTAEEMESTTELKRLRDEYRKTDSGDLPKVSIWSALDAKLVTNLPGARGLAGCNPDGRRIACFGPKGGIQLWSIPEGKLLASFGDDDSEKQYTPGNSEAPLFFGAHSPDGRYIAYGNKKSTRIWSVWDGKLVTTLDSTAKVGSLMVCSVPMVAYLPHGRRVLGVGCGQFLPESSSRH